jgi:hypothetical protein
MVDDAIALAQARQVLITASPGNVPDGVNTPQYPAANSYVISVAATTASGAFATFTTTGKIDFAAPGDKIFSTFYDNQTWSPGFSGYAGTSCASQGGAVSAYGYCSGTSMSAPMIAGSIGVLRSANPLQTDVQTKSALTAHANRFGATASQVGAGVPNIGQSVQDILFGPGGNNGLTPLFILYSSGLTNHLYTTVPQMAMAAISGTLKHGASGYTNNSAAYVSASTSEGTQLATYSFPGAPPFTPKPVAAIDLFTITTRFAVPLVPLYRMSWSNGSGSVDHVYTTNATGISAYNSVGYALDGIEGYLYPNTIAQPLGTVRVYRRYNPTLDRHVLFPEAQLSLFTSLGYTVSDGGNDWIGYACPNPLPSAGPCTKPRPPLTAIEYLLLH